MYHKSMIKIS